MDFTIKIHEDLIRSLSESNIPFLTFNEYLTGSKKRFIILRHDVEQRYKNALEFAQIQHKFGIKGTYFFRILKNHYDEEIVHQIANLGHEIGYHYDDFAKSNGDFNAAIKRFENHLKILRKIAPVKTICMDGSPLSKYDNKALWEKYDYRNFGIIGEPYFDIDFRDIIYLTDTGRCWDGERFSIRDKIVAKERKGERARECKEEMPTFHSTSEIIQALQSDAFPKRAMFTFHPQRWNDNTIPWLTELVFQNIKNQVKRVLVK